MFSVTVNYVGGHSLAIRTPVIADRLPEAERYVVKMLNRVFPDIETVMVHTGDLRYAVYPIDEPIAIVEIVTGGEDVPD